MVTELQATQTIKSTLMAAVQKLLQVESAQVSDTPRLDVELLLCSILECDRSYLFTWPERELTVEQQEKFQTLLGARLQGRPVAHLIGIREFWGLPLKVNDSTLIPRPDTETLVEAALSLPLADHIRLLDLGTGTGAIALALASERPRWNICGVDQSAAAIALAKQNAKQLQLERAVFVESDWFTAVEQTFDVIVSNPPYIDPSDPHLLQGDVRFEPHSALIAGNQGLSDLQWIVQQAPSYLNLNGWLLLEHGYQQGAVVCELMQAKGFIEVSTVKDFGGQDRVTLGRFPHPASAFSRL